MTDKQTRTIRQRLLWLRTQPDVVGFVLHDDGTPREQHNADRYAVLHACACMLATVQHVHDEPLRVLRFKVGDRTSVYACAGPNGTFVVEYVDGSALVKSLPRICRGIAGLRARGYRAPSSQEL